MGSEVHPHVVSHPYFVVADPPESLVPVPRPAARALASAPLLAMVLALAACAAPGAADGAATSGPVPTASSGEAGFAPVTVDNCGTKVTLVSPPQRIVTVKSSVTELALALGAGDRLVGDAFLDGPFPADLAAEGDAVPVLAEKVPASEVVLEQQPDLVWAGWESVFAGDGAGERATLGSLGVATYVSPSACKESGYQPAKLTFDGVFDEITEAGAILGVPHAATELVAEQRTQLAHLPVADTGLTALWYSSGTDTPYVGAGIGAPQMIMDAVGLTNIAAGVADTWTPFSWEQVVADDPDVIVLVDSSWNSAEKKISVLEANPATAQLTAVREQRYLVVPFAATEAGVRNVPAALDLADQLTSLGSPGRATPSAG